MTALAPFTCQPSSARKTDSQTGMVMEDLIRALYEAGEFDPVAVAQALYSGAGLDLLPASWTAQARPKRQAFDSCAFHFKNEGLPALLIYRTCTGALLIYGPVAAMRTTSGCACSDAAWGRLRRLLIDLTKAGQASA